MNFSHHAEQFNFKESQICSNDEGIKHNPPSHHAVSSNFTPVWVLFHCFRHTLNLVTIHHMSLACTYSALWVNCVSHFAMFGLTTHKDRVVLVTVCNPHVKDYMRKSVCEPMMSPCHRLCHSFFFPRADTSESASLGPDSHWGSLCPVGSQLQTCSDNLNQSSSLALAVTQDIERQAEKMHTQPAKLNCDRKWEVQDSAGCRAVLWVFHQVHGPVLAHHFCLERLGLEQRQAHLQVRERACLAAK